MFVVTAKSASLSQAAKALHVEQPGLTRAIKELEGHLGIVLFKRDATRALQLTEKGRAFLSVAERLLADMDSAVSALSEKDRKGILRIGASYAFANAVLPYCLNQFSNDMPGVELQIFEGNSTEINRKITHGELDIGIGMPLGDTSKLHSFQLLTAPMGILLNSKIHHGCGPALAEAVAQRPELTHTNYQSDLYILRFAKQNNAPVIAGSSILSSVSLQIASVNAGGGASICTALGASIPAAQEFDFFPIHPAVQRPTYCFYQASRRPNLLMSSMLEVLLHSMNLPILTLRPGVEWKVTSDDIESARSAWVNK